MKEWRKIARTIIVVLFAPFRILFNRFWASFNSAYERTRELSYENGTVTIPNESSRITYACTIISLTILGLTLSLSTLDFIIYQSLQLYKLSTLVHFSLRITIDVALWLIFYPYCLCLTPAFFVKDDQKAHNFAKALMLFSFAILVQQLAETSIQIAERSSWVMQQQTIFTLIESFHGVIGLYGKALFNIGLYVSLATVVWDTLRPFRKSHRA